MADSTTPIQALTWNVEPSLLPGYLVRGVALILKPSQNLISPLALSVLNCNREVVDIGHLEQTEDSVKITLSELSKGKTYFVLQLKDESQNLVYEGQIQSISEHTGIQLLRQDQKNNMILSWAILDGFDNKKKMQTIL